MAEIQAASDEQTLGISQINEAIRQMDNTTQQNAARLEETTAASEGLTKDAIALVGTVSHFKVAAAAPDRVSLRLCIDLHDDVRAGLTVEVRFARVGELVVAGTVLPAHPARSP